MSSSSVIPVISINCFLVNSLIRLNSSTLKAASGLLYAEMNMLDVVIGLKSPKKKIPAF